VSNAKMKSKGPPLVVAAAFLTVSFFFSCGGTPPMGQERYHHRSLDGLSRVDIPVQGFAIEELPLSLPVDSQINGEPERSAEISRASQLQIEIDHCRSGYRYAGQVDLVALYKGDYGCQVTLQRFKWGPEEFEGILTGPAGTSALFHSAERDLRVTITETLSDPLTDGDEISYSLDFNLEMGGDLKILGLSRGPSTRLKRASWSTRVPHFQVDRVAMQVLNTKDKSFGLAFDVQCAHPMKYDGESLETLQCGQVKLKDLSYKLVQDIYHDYPTVKILDQLFKTSGTRVLPSRDYFRPSWQHHGGFKTMRSGTFLFSPKQTAKNPHMIFVLRSSQGYQLFNLDYLTAVSETR
jgi:hypothetical protein